MKQKASKTPQHSTFAKEVGKNRTWIDYMSEEAYSQFPDKASWRKGFILTMLNWGSSEDAIVLEDFCFEHKLSRSTLWEWREKYPDVKKAVTDLKIFIGARRRRKCMLNQLNTIAYRDMHVYDDEWATLVDKYHSELKKQEEQVAREYNVTMRPADKPKDKE